MRGHLTQRGKKKNSWTGVIELERDPETGKRRQKWITFRCPKPEAEKRLRALLYELDKGHKLDYSKLTLGEYLELWLQDMESQLSYNSYIRYSGIVRNYITPDIGKVLLSDLKPQHIKGHLSRTKLHPRTVRYHYSVLHGALKAAVKSELLLSNPADAVDPPKYDKREMQSWGMDDFNKFLNAIKGHHYYALFYTALFTGLRRSELLGLYWEDVDLLGCVISVKRGYHRRDGKDTFSQPKTKKSTRVIDMPPSLVSVLRSHKEVSAINKLVFHRESGDPLNPNTVTWEFKKACISAGVPVIRLHDARHTHASILAKQGVPIKVIQERLGHSSIQITMDTYAHVLPGMQKQAANNFDKILG